MIVRWYVIALVSFVVLWIIFVVSGSNAYNMVTNMIIGVSGVITIIIVFEVLKRRVKVSD
jgi:capsular polysaccharide biosynthesis protein